MHNAMQDAEAAATAAARAQQAARGGRNALGIDTRRYAAYKTPGIDTAQMFTDPCCMLKDADARRATGDQYLWRVPDDVVTKSMCLRGTIRPVTTDEIDPASPYANINRAKIITKNGPREVVRSPKGLGLFVAPPGIKLSNTDSALLPGEQWDAKYVNELEENREQFASDLETLSASSMQGRISLRDSGLTEKDTQREMVI